MIAAKNDIQIEKPGSDHTWRSKNLQRLLLAGVPERIAKDNRAFWFLVQEGEELGYEGWNTDWISDQEAVELYKLLDEFFENDLDCDLLDRLRKKLGYPDTRC